MTGIPHPSVMIAMAEDHRVELLAQAERHALARSAERAAGRRPQRAQLSAGVALAVALLLAMGVAAAQESPRWPEPRRETAAEPLVFQASDWHLLHTGLARQAVAARQ